MYFNVIVSKHVIVYTNYVRYVNLIVFFVTLVLYCLFRKFQISIPHYKVGMIYNMIEPSLAYITYTDALFHLIVEELQRPHQLHAEQSRSKVMTYSYIKS